MFLYGEAHPTEEVGKRSPGDVGTGTDILARRESGRCRGSRWHSVRHPCRCVRAPARGTPLRQLAFEVAEQEQQLDVFFDTIIVCTVTGSTHAGMIAGFAALQERTFGRPRRVLGIDASATIEETRDQVARIARNTGKLIELGRDLTDDEITLMEGWAGDFYGIPVESTIEAIRLSGCSSE